MGKKEKNKVSDIAKAVGVSPGTVSNALNNRKGVSEHKRNEILEMAKQMGYERSFTKKEEKTIKFIQVKRHGEVVGDTYFFTEVMHGIEKECRNHGYNLLMANINLTEIGKEEAKSYLQKDESSGMIILATELCSDDLDIFSNVDIPLVMLDNCFRDSEFDCVLMSNEDSVFKVVKFLVDMGHRRIGLLHSSAYINNFYYRKKGFYSAMNNYNIKVRDSDVFSLSSTIEGSYKDMLKALEETSDLPTAFFAQNDIIAFGAMRALKEMGYKVPEDVSIIGFDDMLFCETSSPRLTTIRVNKNGMGALAVQRLIERIEKKGFLTPTKTQVRNKIVVRDSVVKIVPEFELAADEIIHSI